MQARYSRPRGRPQVGAPRTDGQTDADETHTLVEYLVRSKWCGYGGGWGSETDLAYLLDGFAADGWRLVRTESTWGLWWGIWWRPKLLMIFERPQYEDVPDTDE